MIEAAKGLRDQAEDVSFDHEIINAADWLDQEPPQSDQIFQDFFDAGDKVAIIGSSKLRKSFFGMQMCLHLAAGKHFLDFKCSRSRKVLIVQLEIKKDHFHRRIKRMADAIFINSKDIDGNLFIMNGRGEDIQIPTIKVAARKTKAEFILIDPLYKLVDGDENSAHDMKPILRGFDEIAEATGAAVAYIHHDPKGRPGDRDIRDRGAGSGVLGRDYDACITLTRHRDDEQAAVVETLLRNYKPRKPFVAEWNVDHFQHSNLPVVTQNSGNAAASAKPLDDYIDDAIKLISEPVYTLEFDSLLHERLGLANNKVRILRSKMIRKGIIQQANRESKRGGGQFIGLPADIEAINQDIKQKKLKLES